tara:strand:- start:748 stop:996 length:249 start_codon:yes stop_codon:yes gene_type:complete
MNSEKKLTKDIKTILIKLFKIKKIESFDIVKNLDSIQMLDLILKIEKKFKIKIEDKLISEKNFQNYGTISLMLKKILNEKKK